VIGPLIIDPRRHRDDNINKRALKAGREFVSVRGGSMSPFIRVST
jgi:hypothetical protein